MADPGLTIYLNNGDSSFRKGTFSPGCPSPGPSVGIFASDIKAVATGTVPEVTEGEQHGHVSLAHGR